MTPPVVARLLLRLLLPPSERRVIVGDLDEEFRRDVLPARGAARARAWYWRQVLSSMPHAVRMRVAPPAARIPGDVRYALRLWRRHPAFAVAAISTQAIGVAVATAVMAVAYAVLLQPLPYGDPERLVKIEEAEGPAFSYQDFVDLRRATRAFDAIAGYSGGSRTLQMPAAAPERVPFTEVTDGFFELLGVAPFAGRTFSAADVDRGAPPVVIITHAAWTRRFGGDPRTIGGTIRLNGQAHTIVGILPGDFEFPLRGRPELWLPMRPSRQQEERGYWHWMEVLGRRRPDVTAAQAASDLQAVAKVFAARDTKWHADAKLHATPLRDAIVGSVRPTIRALLAAVALVVLATCATIAGLLLSRAASRARELSVRAAIGAGRGRLIAQLLTENVMLSLVGGAAGMLAGSWLLNAFVLSMPAARRATLPHFENVGVGTAVACAATALSLATGVLFGLLPAWRASRGDAGGALKAARATDGKAESRTRFALASVQVAVALVLLSGAALLAISMHRLLTVSPGFDPDGVVTMRINLPAAYEDVAAVNAFHERLRERLEAIPGVLAAAAIDQPPLTGPGNSGSLSIVERPLPPGQRGPDVGLRTVTANYFEAMRIPVVRGRAFAPMDAPETPKVVLINQLLAERLLPGGDPIGQHVTFEFAPGPFEIVGIVGNERFDDMDRPLLPVVYFAARQDGLSSATLMVRTSEPSTLAGAARAALAEVDPTVPLFAVRTYGEITGASEAVFMRRTAMWLVGIFAAAAALLAAMGLYGVLAQAVAERTREIGVRVALGASRGRIFALVLRRGLTAAAIGLAVGAVAAIAASRLLASLLFGIRPADPLVLAAAGLTLVAIAVVSCAIPAVRAVRIDPAIAVRTD